MKIVNCRLKLSKSVVASHAVVFRGVVISCDTLETNSAQKNVLWLFYYHMIHTKSNISDNFPNVFCHLPNISDNFLNIVRGYCPKVLIRTFQTSSKRFPNISEICQSLLRAILRFLDWKPTVFSSHIIQTEKRFQRRSQSGTHVTTSLTSHF